MKPGLFDISLYKPSSVLVRACPVAFVTLAVLSLAAAVPMTDWDRAKTLDAGIRRWADQTGSAALLYADVRADGNWVLVTGRIRNTSHRPQRALEMVAVLEDDMQTPLTMRSALTKPTDVEPYATVDFYIALDRWPGGRRVSLTLRHLEGTSFARRE